MFIMVDLESGTWTCCLASDQLLMIILLFVWWCQWLVVYFYLLDISCLPCSSSISCQLHCISLEDDLLFSYWFILTF
jgi:hypothetical protein